MLLKLSTIARTRAPQIALQGLPGAPGNKNVRRAVIRQWCKQCEGQPVPRFVVEAPRLIAFWQFHPARDRILLILITDSFGDARGDRSRACDRCRQRLLLERFANLLAQNLLIGLG